MFNLTRCWEGYYCLSSSFTISITYFRSQRLCLTSLCSPWAYPCLMLCISISMRESALLFLRFQGRVGVQKKYSLKRYLLRQMITSWFSHYLKIVQSIFQCDSSSVFILIMNFIVSMTFLFYNLCSKQLTSINSNKTIVSSLLSMCLQSMYLELPTISLRMNFFSSQGNPRLICDDMFQLIYSVLNGSIQS